MRVRSAVWRLALSSTLWFCACAELPEVKPGECGNSIVEQGEECDTFDLEGVAAQCRPPGRSGGCHLDCSARSDGTRPACPPGWGCGFDDLCHVPTGLFTALSRSAVGGVDALTAGDFDGDGRSDLLSRKPHDLVGRATLAFHYFDERSNLVETRPLSILSTLTAIGTLSNDNRDDVVFSDTRLGVLKGRQDRTWVPEAYTPYVLPGVRARVVGVSDGQIGTNDRQLGTNEAPVAMRDKDGMVVGSAPIATLTTREAGTGLYAAVADNSNGQLSLRAALPLPVEQVAGELVTANVFDAPSSPCREVLLAYRGTPAFEVVDLCGLDAHSGLPLWSSTARHLSVALEPAAPVETGPLAVDLNGDAHLDVLIGAGGLVYAALGDGSTFARAVPFQPPVADSRELGGAFPMPLAASDFTGDGVVDYVLPNRLMLSWRQPGDALPHYTSGLINLGYPWTVARITDLNGNGFPDVVAAAQGSLNVDFFNGTGTRNLVAAQIPSGRPVSQLALGDFDGDLIRDLAFVEASGSESELDTLMIAFGALFATPSTPSAVARVRHVEQLSTFGDNGIDTVSVVATHTVDGQLRTSVYVIGGSSARIPFSPLELISFATDGSVLGVAALSVALGSFTAPGHKDVISLVSDEAGSPGFWLVPSIDGDSPTPELLGGTLAASLVPSPARRLGKSYLSSQLYATSAVADLDRDGRDELVWAMPYDEPEPPDELKLCGLAIYGVTGDTKHELQARGQLTLDAPCLDPKLQAVDADQDGWPDLVLLTGSERAADRKLFVLWNDRAGGFSAAASTLIDSAGDAPQAFTVLPPTQPTGAKKGSPLRLAYVTRSALMLSSFVQPRAFEPPALLGKLTDGTGIVAADLNGDSAIDLALADNGDLVVFSAELEGL